MKIAIVGLDGLDPQYLDRWRDDLPTLDSLIASGSVGELRSSDPPLTVPAWPTMYTGKQGGKHGVFSFTHERSDSYEQVPVNYTDIHAESLWEALDSTGLSCGVVNVPLTHPPSDLDNGFVVSGWPVPTDAELSHDPDAVAALEADLDGSYRVNPFPLSVEFDQLDNRTLCEEIAAGLDHHRQAFTGLLDRRGDELDVFFCVFMAIDVASHNFAFEPEYLKQIYVAQDRALGALLERIPDDTNLVVMSDHGHGVRGEWSFHINEWLARNGYLSRSQPDGTDFSSILDHVGLTQERLVAMKNRLALGAIHERLPQRVVDVIADVVPRAGTDTREFEHEVVDWSETVAYSAQQNLISINTQDRPEGTVSAEEYGRIREELVADLEAISHPEREKSLISDIFLREELFEGAFVDTAPDLVFVADEMRCNAPMGFAEQVFLPEQWGEHRQEGVLLTSGPAFKQLSESPSQRDITDIMPLALALCDVHIPENVDGTVPSDRLAVECSPTYRESRDETDAARRYSAAESDEITTQLEALGYLE